MHLGEMRPVGVMRCSGHEAVDGGITGHRMGWVAASAIGRSKAPKSGERIIEQRMVV
jgi:hypothetical protein